MNLKRLADSLRKAFGNNIGIDILEDELRLTVAGKTAWIDGEGNLTGESGVGPAALEIGVDIVSVVVPSTGAAIATGI